MVQWAFGPNTRLSLLDSRLLKTSATYLEEPLQVRASPLCGVCRLCYHPKGTNCSTFYLYRSLTNSSSTWLCLHSGLYRSRLPLPYLALPQGGCSRSIFTRYDGIRRGPPPLYGFNTGGKRSAPSSNSLLHLPQAFHPTRLESEKS